jgi:DNA-binding transcriptional LysR family regulator
LPAAWAGCSSAIPDWKWSWSPPRFVSIPNREAEISIHLERPSVDQLVTRKLTDYRLALYASRAYLDRHPPIEKREDLAAHAWIDYVDDLLFSQN